MKMIFVCEWIKTIAGTRPKVNETGQYLRNEKGHYIYEKCERYTVRLVPVGFPMTIGAVTDPSVHENAKVWRDVHGVVGSILLEHISAEAAAQFKVEEQYAFEPVLVPQGDER